MDSRRERHAPNASPYAILPSSIHRADCDGFYQLPNEMLLLILSFLVHDPRSLLGCRGVCRRLRDCINGSAPLQLAVKLELWGYKLDSNLPTYSSSNLLQSLEEHVQSWRDLNWEKTTIDIPLSHGNVYDLAHGYFASASSASSFKSVTVVRLPTPSRRRTESSNREDSISPQAYTLPQFSFMIKQLAIDPSQDLLILEEKWVRELCVADIVFADSFCHYSLHLLPK